MLGLLFLSLFQNGMQGGVEQAMPVPDSHNEIESTLQNLKFKTQVSGLKNDLTLSSLISKNRNS